MLGKKLNGLCLARNVATASRPVREPRVAAQPSPEGLVEVQPSSSRLAAARGLQQQSTDREQPSSRFVL